MSIFKQMGANWTANTKSKPLGEAAKKGLWTFLGGTLYWLFPTAIQGFGKVDMSGLKGVFVGVIGTSLTGILADKKEIIAGGITAGGVHLTYNHLNGTITNIFNSPIFGYGKGSVQSYTETGIESLEAQSTGDEAPAGYGYNSAYELVALNPPDGSLLQAPVQSTSVTPVADYRDDLDSTKYKLQAALNDRVNKLGGFAPSPTNALAQMQM